MLFDLDPSLLDTMSEGIILLNHQAQVMGSNKTAASWLHVCQTATPTLRRIIAEGLIGRTHFPVSIDFLFADPADPANSSSSVTAWLCKNSPQEYAVFIVPPRVPVAACTPGARPETTDQRYVALMGDQIRLQIAQFHQLVPKAQGDAALQAHLLQIDVLLEEISNLSVLKQRDQVFSSDRIDLNELIRSVIAQLALTDHEFDTGTAPQGVIYGDAPWLSYAFNVLFSALMRGLAPRCSLHIKTGQLGDFIVVSGRSVLHEPKMLKEGQAPDVGQSDSPATHESISLSTRMLVCQRICELHSGFLKIEFLPPLCGTDTDMARPIASFVLTLQSGLPTHERSRVSCSECRLNLQAQAYAADLATLLSNSSR